MTELLFIAITIFFIYVVFQVIGKPEEPEADQADSKPAAAPEPAKQPAVVAEPVKATAATETVKATNISSAPPSPAKAVAKTTTSKRTTKTAKATPTNQAAPAKTPPEPAPVAASTAGDSVKNPKTGEVAKISGNYAFAKRWIKDALVEEGLLDKVYKNNELDAATTAKILDALQKLKAMPKYQ